MSERANEIPAIIQAAFERGGLDGAVNFVYLIIAGTESRIVVLDTSFIGLERQRNKNRSNSYKSMLRKRNLERYRIDRSSICR